MPTVISFHKKDFYDKEEFYYHRNISVISPEIAFPKKFPKKGENRKTLKPLLNIEDYKNHYEDFLNKISSIEFNDSFDKFYITLLSLLERYCWCIPSAVNEKISDISLYDHLKSTSAIAACIYLHHKLEKSFNETSIIKPGKYKLLLLAGDMAGIQNYIYQLKGSFRLAKRLRARSFFITILLETIIHWILEKFSLPISCCLTKGGGSFLLLLPKSEYIYERLEEIYFEISKKLYKEFFGEISLNLTWKEEETEDKIRDILLTEFGFTIYDFFRHAEKTYDSLEIEKYNKFNKILLRDKGWSVEKFFIDDEIWKKYGIEKRVCQICGKFPAESSEVIGGNTIEQCKKCELDQTIGKYLTKTNFISFERKARELPAKDQYKLSFNTFDNISVTLWTGNEQKIKYTDFYMILTLPSRNNTNCSNKQSKEDTKNQTNDNEEITPECDQTQKNSDVKLPSGYAHTFLANHIPIFKDKTEVDDFKNKYKDFISQDDEDIEVGNPYSFSALAALSVSIKNMEDIRHKKGSPLIGVLKADVDRLGLVFNRGFKGICKKKKSGVIEGTDRVTPSRYLTMSRMVDLFFSGWLHSVMSNNMMNIHKDKDNMDFSKIYTVYSGGDDLLLVGPWETIIYFADELYQKFRDFTCKNEDITLSAGIVVVKPKIPVNKWSAMANEALLKSKKMGRDRLTLFDTTIKWDELGDLIEFMEILHKEMPDEELNQNKSLLTMGFLYRLLRYNQMYRRFIERGEVKNLIYLSHMAYDIKRNILDKFITGINGNESEKERRTEEFKRENRLYNKLIQLHLIKKDTKDNSEDKLNKDDNMSLRNRLKNRLMENLRIPVTWTIYKNRR